MSKEQLLGDSDIDINVIAEMAKENLLRHGSHSPTVIAVGDGGKGIGQLEGALDSHEERLQAMWALGAIFRRKKDLGQLRQIYFVSEGWLSDVRKSGAKLMQPSLDPNRIEVLVVSELDLRNSKTNMLPFEIVRDVNRKLVEIKPYDAGDAKGGETKSTLLEAFVLGYYVSVAGTNGKHLH